MAYNPIKRIRAWFFQDNIPTEPRTYTDANGTTVTKQVKTRFAKGHFPKEESFKDLIETTFLKSASGDLQDVATTENIELADDVEKVVKPNQLPEIEPDIAGSSTLSGTTATQNGFSGSVFESRSRIVGSKKKWAYYFSTPFVTWLFQKLVPKSGTTGQVLTKNSNADYDVRWETLPVSGSGLPAGGTTNQYLRKINNTDYNTTWATLDTYTQAEINTLLNNETNDRTELDAYITNNNTAVVPLSYYSDKNLDIFKTRLDGIDIVNGTQTTNIANNTSAITGIINGATLPTSSLAGLQSQINSLSPTNLNQAYTVIISDEPRVLSNSMWYSKIGNRVFLSSYSVIKVVTGSVWASTEAITYTMTLPTIARPHTTTSEISSIVIVNVGSSFFTTTMSIFNNGMIRIYAPALYPTFDGNCNIYIPTVSYLTN